MNFSAPINIASQPFRRERAQNAAFALVCGILTISLLVLISLMIHARAQAADLRLMIESDTAELHRVERDNAQWSLIIAKPENADVFSRSVFLNEIIARRAVSWTRVFKDLETVLPSDMRLMGIRLPQVAAEDSGGANHVQLEMQLGTNRPAAIIDLLDHLQQSALFGPAQVTMRQPPTQNDPLYKFRVSVAYAQNF